MVGLRSSGQKRLVSARLIYALAFTALIAMGAVFVGLVHQTDVARSWVFHTYDVQTSLQSARLNAATGKLDAARKDVQNVAVLTRDNLQQQGFIGQLLQAIQSADMVNFDAIAQSMIRNEEQLLQTRRRALQSVNKQVYALFFSLSLATAGAIAWTIKSNREHHIQLQSKNDALTEASRAKDVFLASMSHELRTPLNSIMGFVGILLMKLPGPLTEEQERQLRIVQGSARHLLSLINDILDLARIESGRVDLLPQRVSISKVIDEVADELRGLAEQKGLSFAADVSGDEMFVRTDERTAKQILTNIVGNAVKFTKNGGVRISLTRSSDKALVVVNDTGPGVPPEQQARLFAPFAQFRHSPSQEGTGLGLHLSRKLAGLVGATIEVNSKIGEGSMFSVTFPLDA